MSNVCFSLSQLDPFAIILTYLLTVFSIIVSAVWSPILITKILISPLPLNATFKVIKKTECGYHSENFRKNFLKILEFSKKPLGSCYLSYDITKSRAYVVGQIVLEITITV